MQTHTSKPKTFLKTCLAAVVVGAFAANASAQDTHPVTGEKLAENQELIHQQLDEAASIDPSISEGTIGAIHIRDLFEALYNSDPQGNVEPGVALSHELSDDKLVYTFKLREDAKWSDGSPVTAHDFEYAWKRATDPATGSKYAWYFELMGLENAKAVVDGEVDPSELGVTAIDDYTLEARLSTPIPYFPKMLPHATTMPVPKAVIEEHGDQWTKPENIVSNGAYKLTEYTLNERMVKEPNEYYWDNENTIIDKVTTVTINDQSAALTRFLAGEVDMTDEVPAGQFNRLLEEYPEQARAVPRLCNYYFTYNLSDSGIDAFKDVRVRKALAYAIDRDVITNQILQGGQPSAYSFTPEATADFQIPEIDYATWTQAERDAKAKELMEEAGYGEDNPLSFSYLYNTSENHKQVAIVASQMWKQKLGVEVTLNNMEWKTFLDTRSSQNFEMARGAWCGDYNEASTFLDILTTRASYNHGVYQNEDYDQLLADARTADNPSELYTAAEQILAEEMPIIPIYHYTKAFMIKDDIKGYPFENAETKWYSRDMYRVAE